MPPGQAIEPSSRSFIDANEQLIAEANANDLDGATLAYVQLTLSCVNCHKLVRDAKSAKPNP